MNLYQNLYNRIRDALREAITDFIPAEEIFTDEVIREAASEYVYNRDEEIRSGLRDCVSLEAIMDEVIDDAIEDAYEEY